MVAKARKLSSPVESQIHDEERSKMIAEAAYFLAEKRGFAGGNPVEDWITAEREVLAKLKQRTKSGKE